MIPELTRHDSQDPARAWVTEPPQERVTIGISLGSRVLSSWEYCALEQVCGQQWVTIAFVVTPPASVHRRKSPTGPDPITRWYSSFDARRSHLKPDALQPRETGELLKDLPHIEFDEANTKVATIPEVDVIIHFGSAKFPESFATRTRYGVWHYPESNHGWQHGFTETLARTDTVTAGLHARLASGQTIRLALSHGSAGDPSPVRVRNPSLWKSSMFVIRCLYRLARRKGDFFSRAGTVNNASQQPVNRPALVLRHAASTVLSKLPRRFFLDQWHILFKFQDGHPASISLDEFSPMIPPKDRFWADPFVIHRDGKYYLFIEESLMKPRKKGFISVIVMNEDGTYSEPVKIIEQPYHLSYPFLFDRDGELFMIPEAGQSGAIDLYHCEEFPFRWKRVKTIMQGVQAVDTTLVVHDDRWWMFANMTPIQGISLWDELYIFSTNDPVDGRWTPHPMNPVISDARQSRPAGSFFSFNGVLYRPSQDCGRRYGFALNINEVLRLNTHEYEERIHARVEPPSGSPLKAIHTVNRAGRLTVMDGILRRARFV